MRPPEVRRQVDPVVVERAADVALVLAGGRVFHLKVAVDRAHRGADEAALHALALAVGEADNAVELVGVAVLTAQVVVIVLCNERA